MSGDPRKPSKEQRQAAAREKARALREQKERAERRRRLAVVTAASIAVVAVVTVVGVAIASGGEDEVPQAVPASATADGGFRTGEADAPVDVAVYLDYQCPYCAEFEEANGPYLEELRAAGDVSVTYYPLDILSRLGDYSTRAASAAVCVAEEAPDSFVAFNDELYVQQPVEGAGGLTDDQLVGIAEQVGVPADVDGCITDGRYTGWVTQATADRDERVEGTPALFVDDQLVAAPDFRDTVDAAVEAAGAA